MFTEENIQCPGRQHKKPTCFARFAPLAAIKLWGLVILALFCLFTPIHAQDSSTSELDRLQQMVDSAGGIGEMSLLMLNSVTGNMPELMQLTGKPVPTLGQINANFFKVFTQGVFIFAMFAGGYAVIMGVVGTSSDGEAFGNKLGKDKFFLFFRTTTSFLLFLPTTYGYSVVQLILNRIAIESVALANATWKTIAVAMLTYQGGIGNIVIGTGGLSQQMKLLQVSGCQQKATVDTQQTSKNDLKTQLLSDSVTNIPNSYMTSFLVSSQCIMNDPNTKIKYTMAENSSSGQETVDATDYYEKINTIIDDFQQQVFTTNGCPTSNPCTIKYQYTSDDASKSTGDCGEYKVKVSVTDSFSNNDIPGSPTTIANDLVVALRRIKDQALAFYLPNKNFNGGGCTSASDCLSTEDAQIVANTMFAITDSWVASTQFYANANYQTSADAASGNNPDLDDLINGGWAMAASNYMYYTKVMAQNDSQVCNDSDSTPSGNNKSSKDAVTIDYVDNQTSDLKANYLTAEENTNQIFTTPLIVGGSVYNSELEQINEIYDSSPKPMTTEKCNSIAACRKACSENFGRCDKIMKYIGGYVVEDNKAGDFSIGEDIKYFYESFNGINDDEPSSFAQLESGAKVCGGLPFVQGQVCSDELSTSNPVVKDVAIAAAVVIPVIGIALLMVPMFKQVLAVVYMGIVAAIAPFAFMGAAEGFYTITVMFSDPSKLYPAILGKDLQAFAYWMAKAWVDVFGWNQQNLFTYPIHSIANYGTLVMQYGVSFLIRIGTDTFTSNMSSSFYYFMNKFYISIAMDAAMILADSVQTYGDEWLMQPVPLTQLQWFSDVFTRVGIPLPPFLFIIWLIFIPIPIYLIIGAILKVVGYAIYVGVAVAQIVKLIAFNDFLLQVQLFINELYNPIYFAVSIPAVVMGATFAFMMPLYPVVIYAMAVISWVTFYVEAVLATPIILFGMANPKGQGLLGEARQALIVMLILYLKPFLTVMGFFYANMMASFAILIYTQMALPLLNTQLGIWADALGKGNDAVHSVMTILSMALFVYAYYQIITFSFGMIFKIPNAIFKWIGAQSAGGEEEMQKMQQVSDEFVGAIEKVGGAATDVAGKQGGAGKQFGANQVGDNVESKQKGQAETEKESSKGLA